ncbi:hypothetical protein GQ457_05G014100 [Hibiscus cannabinus]
MEKFKIYDFAHNLKSNKFNFHSNVVAALEGTGFENVIKATEVSRHCYPFLQALLRRYNRRVKCFEFGVNNSIRLFITLGDVLRITGLPIDDRAVIVDESSIDLKRLCSKYLGSEQLLHHGDINLPKLQSSFGNFQPCGIVKELKYHVRAYILYIIGSVLAPSPSSSVPALYLQLLRKVERIGQYAWGATMLAHLYYHLDTMEESKYCVSGNFHLLSMFIFERIPWIVSHLLHPRGPIILPEEVNDRPREFPLMVEWHSKMAMALKNSRSGLKESTFTGTSPTLFQEDVGDDEHQDYAGNLSPQVQIDEGGGGLQQDDAYDAEEDVEEDEHGHAVLEHVLATPPAQEPDRAGALTLRPQELLTYISRKESYFIKHGKASKFDEADGYKTGEEWYIGGSGRDLMGDILDEFLRQRFGIDCYEHVDNGVIPSKKQSALNRFNNERERFIFLLETRACLPSIKLSSVGTVIIFGSDWSPEKLLMLSKQDKAIYSNIANISPSASHMLLKWGASYLFIQLENFHGITKLDASTLSQQSHLKDVIQEFLTLLHQTGKDNTSKLTLILQAKQNQGTYRTEMPLFGELKIQEMNEDPPHTFWTKLLEGKCPRWKYSTSTSLRNQKRVPYFDELQKRTEAESAEVAKKRKKFISDGSDHPSPKAVLQEGKLATGDREGSPRTSAYDFTTFSRSIASGSDKIHASSTSLHQANNISKIPALKIVEWERRKECDSQKDLHVLLRPQIAKLCEVLHLTEDVKAMVERYDGSPVHTEALA